MCSAVITSNEQFGALRRSFRGLSNDAARTARSDQRSLVHQGGQRRFEVQPCEPPHVGFGKGAISCFGVRHPINRIQTVMQRTLGARIPAHRKPDGLLDQCWIVFYAHERSPILRIKGGGLCAFRTHFPIRPINLPGRSSPAISGPCAATYRSGKEPFPGTVHSVEGAFSCTRRSRPPGTRSSGPHSICASRSGSTGRSSSHTGPSGRSNR